MSAKAASASTPSSSSSWAGPAPVSEGDFAFANGDFFALASGGNRHRRATREELSAHFHAGGERDHPAHWFEAQLVHYGLKTSKTKSVARMRLFDAVQGGGLAVPAHVAALEVKLKKEWTRRDRLAKKTGAVASDAPPAATKAKRGSGSSSLQDSSTKAAGARPSKRKADVIVNVTVNAVTTIAAKKAKTGDDTKKTTTPKTKTTTPKTTAPKVKQTARRGTSASSRGPRGGLSRNESSTRASTAYSSPAPIASPMRSQVARRSRVLVTRGRIPAPKRDPDSSPPPYFSEARDTDDNDDDNDDDDDDDDDENLAPLGLLNGHYDIRSQNIDDQWPQYLSDFDLVLTLSGTTLWGRFNLGIVEGVLFFETRPYASSHVALSFRWRGREDSGPISYDDSENHGWIKFMGGGRIQGWIDFQGGISFRGRRAPGQGTRSEVSARVLQDEWDEYSEREYERERIGRWH